MDNIKKLYNLMPEDCKGFSETQLLKAENAYSSPCLKSSERIT